MNMNEEQSVRLQPVVHFREFPFGSLNDPSMREYMASAPWPNQGNALQYLRSGLILALPMGADLLDWFDRPNRANPQVEGQTLGGATPLTDGQWFWPAGLIHFVEKYNVRLPDEFLEHAAKQQWQVNKDSIPSCRYDFSYWPSRQHSAAQ